MRAAAHPDDVLGEPGKADAVVGEEAGGHLIEGDEATVPRAQLVQVLPPANRQGAEGRSRPARAAGGQGRPRRVGRVGEGVGREGRA